MSLLGWGAHHCRLKRNYARISSEKVKTLGHTFARLAEIDENLARANLTSAQEASAINRRKEIYEVLHPETKAGLSGALARWDENAVASSATASFTAATAKATGRAKRTIRDAAARGNRLGDDLKDVARRYATKPRIPGNTPERFIIARAILPCIVSISSPRVFPIGQ